MGSRRWLWANRGWEPGHLLRTEECGVEEGKRGLGSEREKELEM